VGAAAVIGLVGAVMLRRSRRRRLAAMTGGKGMAVGVGAVGAPVGAAGMEMGVRSAARQERVHGLLVGGRGARR
jgi:hypothetical protein